MGLLVYYALDQPVLLRGSDGDRDDRYRDGELYAGARRGTRSRNARWSFLERPERVVLVIIGALFNRMAPPVLWVIAVLSNITVISRMLFTWQATNRLENAQT